MLVVYNAVDIPDHPGQRALATVVFDDGDFKLLRSEFTPGFGILRIDQTTLANQTLATDLFNHLGVTDFQGLHKYYCKTTAGGQLWQRGGWVRAPTVYTPTLDVLQGPTRSVERAAFEDNVLTDLQRLDQIEAGSILAPIAVQDLARQNRRLLKMIQRLLTPAG